MNARPTARSIAPAALLVLLASCDQPRPEPPEQPPSPTAAERDADDGPDLGIDAAKDGGSAFLGPLTTSVAGEGEDQDFLRKAAAANALELAAADIAVSRASTDTIRRLAQTIVRDHNQLKTALHALAQAKGVEVPAATDAQASDDLAALRNETTGSNFDEAYVELTAENHERAVELFKAEIDATRDADIRDFADSALPILNRHLESTRGLEPGMRMPD